MPIYEFCCKNCDHIFEEWCKQVEEMESTRECPQCTQQAKRIMSQTSFALKGEGWYVTEYGSHKNAPKEENPTQSDTTPADSATASSTSEPASADVKKPVEVAPTVAPLASATNVAAPKKPTSPKKDTPSSAQSTTSA